MYNLEIIIVDFYFKTNCKKLDFFSKTFGEINLKMFFLININNINFFIKKKLV